MKRLEEIKQRVEAATGGPWRRCGTDKFNVQFYAQHAVCVDGASKQVIFSSEPVGNPEGAGNANFIAHSREDISLLVRCLEMAIKAMKYTRDECACDTPEICFDPIDTALAAIEQELERK